MSKLAFSLFSSSGQLFCARQRIPSIFNRLPVFCSVSGNSGYFHSKANTLSGQNSVAELFRKLKFSVECRNNTKFARMSTLMETQIISSPKKQKLTNGKENQAVWDDSKLYFLKDGPNAQTPTKGSKLAAGYDLKSAQETIVPARGSALVQTEIKIKVPHGTYGRIAPRSGLAWKNKIDVGAGVIDEDYRGKVGVILFNHSDVDFKVEIGDRIAQLICEKIAYPEIVEVDSLDDSERGANGFGSTGTKN